MAQIVRIESLKSDLGVTGTVEFPTSPLADGEVLARIERIALTTNNMTYAVYGDSIGYWNLFPANQSGYGCIPAWGYAEIVESRVSEIPLGTRVFGYFPIATHLAMKPTAVTSRSFVDGASHRTGTPKVYNLYEFQPQGPDPRMDSLISLFRALFITSYTAEDYLAERLYFGAEQFVISSASSKTAYGIAHCLSDVATPKIGLTSRRNKSFVEGLGCYDATYEYEEMTDIDPSKSTVYVDLSGDDMLHRRVHEHFRDRLAFDCLVGSTQSTSFPERDRDLPGPDPVFFFAALQLDSYKAAGELPSFMQRYLRDERVFLERIADPRHPWMMLVEHSGLDDAPAVITDLHNGSTDPSVGHVFDLTIR